ncbi:ABC transporter permease [Stella sp.]|uniref:ABC transporter permease n=1 Tax=Stella sp. TaxID=2912054 RepID=UPI0035B3702E
MSMFLVGRLLRAVTTIMLLVTVTFLALRLTGDPAVALLGNESTPEGLKAFHERWGLDRPLPEQYAIYLGNLAGGDFGRSFIGDRAAWAVVFERLPGTLALMGFAILFAVAAGVPAGIAAALYRNSWIDRVTMTVAATGFSVPSFVVGVLLIVIFGVVWRALPTTGDDTAWHYVLPVLTLGTADMALYARFTRSAMLEVLGRPYIRTAEAKGVPWRAVILRHALPNASIALVTILGMHLGRSISGAVVTENVFAWSGVGRLLVQSVANRDFAVVQTVVILVGATMVLANLLVDLSYSRLDPRTRAAGRAR